MITPQYKADPIQEGIVSGGQTQTEIDAEMDKIVRDYKHVFNVI